MFRSINIFLNLKFDVMKSIANNQDALLNKMSLDKLVFLKELIRDDY